MRWAAAGDRAGGCLGYYRSAGSTSPGPELLTGPCAEYALTLRSDGTAEYIGRRNVPLLGRRVGRLAIETFNRLARLADEIRFEEWGAALSGTGAAAMRLDVRHDGRRRSSDCLHHPRGWASPDRKRSGQVCAGMAVCLPIGNRPHRGVGAMAGSRCSI